MKAFIFWVGAAERRRHGGQCILTYPLPSQRHRKPAEHAEVVFPAQESQFGIAKLFLSFPLFPSAPQAILAIEKARKAEGKGREREGGERKSNRGVASSEFGSHGW